MASLGFLLMAFHQFVPSRPPFLSRNERIASRFSGVAKSSINSFPAAAYARFLYSINPSASKRSYSLDASWKPIFISNSMLLR